MFQEIREIPPAPREVRWRAVLWHRWPVALIGFALAIYGGVFTLMLYLAAGGKPSDEASLDLNPILAEAEITEIEPNNVEGKEWVSYQFADAAGEGRSGRSIADEGAFRVAASAEVEYLERDPSINRLRDSNLHLLPAWVEPSLFLGLLVLPGVLALGLWFQGVFDLKRMMSHGDVAIAEVIEVRRLRGVLPTMLAVCYRFRDHRAILRVGRHWVRARSSLGEHLATGPRHMPVLHHRRWPQFSRLALVQDFHKRETPTHAPPGEVRPRA